MLDRVWTIVYAGREQDNLSSVDVASMGDFDSEDSDDAIGFNSDEGSVAELEWNTWDDACAWEFQNAPGVFPMDSAVTRPSGDIKGQCILHSR